MVPGPLYIISLQPFVSNTFELVFLFCVPSRPLQNESTREDFTTVRAPNQLSIFFGIGQLLKMDDVALVSTKRTMSHEKLSFVVRTMWATSVGVSGSS